MDEFSFPKLEKCVMTYLILNKSKLCNFAELYNHLLDVIIIYIKANKPAGYLNSENLIATLPINDIKLLKLRLSTIIMYLDANQNNITSLKHNGQFLVGYGIENNFQDDLHIEPSDDLHLKPNQELFEYIVDENIEYHRKVPDIIGNTLLHYGVMYNDPLRIEKIIKKYDLSFYTENLERIKPVDLITETNLMVLKFVMDEHYIKIQNLKTIVANNDTNDTNYIKLILFNILTIITLLFLSIY